MDNKALEELVFMKKVNEAMHKLDHDIDEFFILFGHSPLSEFTLFTNNYRITPLRKENITIGVKKV